MLLSEKVKRLMAQQNNMFSEEFYLAISKDIEAVRDSLQDDINAIDKKMNANFAAQKEELRREYTQNLESKTNNFFTKINELNLTLTNQALAGMESSLNENIKSELSNHVRNLPTKIDLSGIINSIKTDPAVISNVKSESIKNTCQALETHTDSIVQKAQNTLIAHTKGRISHEAIIKEALSGINISGEVLKEIKERVAQLISQKQDVVNKELDSFKKNMNDRGQKTLDTHTENLNKVLQAGKDDATTHLNTLITQNVETSQGVISTYKQDLDDNKPQIVETIIERIFNAITQDENTKQEIKDNITHKGYEYLLTFTDELKENIEIRVKEYFAENLTEDELKEYILGQEHTLKLVKDSSYVATKDRLTHPLVKEYVETALKEKAKEILKSDELLSIEAEAQAHLVMMRLQSQLSSVQECFIKLNEKYEIENQMAILVEKERVFDETLKNAKDKLNNEIVEKAKNALQILNLDDINAKIESLQKECEEMKQKLDEKTQTDTTQDDEIVNVKEALEEYKQKTEAELKAYLEELKKQADAGDENAKAKVHRYLKWM